MSDFLISIGNKNSPEGLLSLLKQPYNGDTKEGQCFSFPWGSMAVLEEHIANNKNIIVCGDTVASWIGDLVLDVPEQFIINLIDRVDKMTNDNNENTDLKSDKIFCQLNGAFAITLAKQKGFCVITDPLNFTQVYVGKDVNNNPLCVGSHPDLVSVLCDTCSPIDVASVGAFLSQGTPIFPHTMYKNVKELDPGRIHIFKVKKQKTKTKTFLYWYPPQETQKPYDKDHLVRQLREKLVNAIHNRCNGQKVGVTLSGGLDSRLIMAVVPKELECVGLTFCDHQNRETRIAKRVAQCYGRQWIPIIRGRNFLADCLLRTVELQGCEFDFVNAHAVGIEEKIANIGLSSILSGVQMDVYFKGFFAADWLCKKRLKGLLDAKYIKTSCDYVNTISEFDNKIFTKEIISQIMVRKQQNFSEYVDWKRGSIKEWLNIYPFSQDKIGACWAAERRILPVRIVATDRRLLDFAFRCPIELKLGSRVFIEATLNLYGEGSRIPSANDGVRPGSGHIWRLVQRAIQKSKVRVFSILGKMGIETKIPHSWHDYQKCWSKSEKIHELIQKYSTNLEQLDGILFKENSRALLENKDIDWHYGFRLLQLAVWLGIIRKYRILSGSMQ